MKVHYPLIYYGGDIFCFHGAGGFRTVFVGGDAQQISHFTGNRTASSQGSQKNDDGKASLCSIFYNPRAGISYTYTIVMTKTELEYNLDSLDVHPDQYSLYGELKLNAFILDLKPDNYEVYYIDERNEKSRERSFDSEGEACDYIYRIFQDSKKLEDKYGIKIYKHINR